MFSTSSLYFIVAIFGERIETSEAHGMQFVDGQGDETAESSHKENQEGTQNQTHNEFSDSTKQRHEEGQIEPHSDEKAPSQSEINESNHPMGIETEEASHKESAPETQRKNLELPFSIGA